MHSPNKSSFIPMHHRWSTQTSPRSPRTKHIAVQTEEPLVLSASQYNFPLTGDLTNDYSDAINFINGIHQIMNNILEEKYNECGDSTNINKFKIPEMPNYVSLFMLFGEKKDEPQTLTTYVNTTDIPSEQIDNICSTKRLEDFDESQMHIPLKNTDVMNFEEYMEMFQTLQRKSFCFKLKEQMGFKETDNSEDVPLSLRNFRDKIEIPTGISTPRSKLHECTSSNLETNLYDFSFSPVQCSSQYGIDKPMLALDNDINLLRFDKQEFISNCKDKISETGSIYNRDQNEYIGQDDVKSMQSEYNKKWKPILKKITKETPTKASTNATPRNIQNNNKNGETQRNVNEMFDKISHESSKYHNKIRFKVDKAKVKPQESSENSDDSDSVILDDEQFKVFQENVRIKDTTSQKSGGDRIPQIPTETIAIEEPKLSKSHPLRLTGRDINKIDQKTLQSIGLFTENGEIRPGLINIIEEKQKLASRSYRNKQFQTRRKLDVQVHFEQNMKNMLESLSSMSSTEKINGFKQQTDVRTGRH